MNTCIKCGSHAFNLKRDGIDQGGFCDVHYWQGMASRLTAERDVFKEACASGWGEPTLVNQLRAERDAALVDAKRLDWLDRECSKDDGRRIVCLPGALRSAIDAAIAKDVSK